MDGSRSLFDLNTRRFYLFDLILYPQDFIYLAALLVLSALALFFFTAVAGRLWCGFCLPPNGLHRNFHVDRKALRGRTAGADQTGPAPGLSTRRGAKAANTLPGAFSVVDWADLCGLLHPIQTLVAETGSLALGPWEAFWIVFYALATYGNAGYLREQVCKYMCPYARFQGVMIDGDSLIVGYDTARGENRGSRSKSADRAKLGLGGLRRLHHVRSGVPGGHRHSQWLPDGMHWLWGLHRCLRHRDGQDEVPTRLDSVHHPKRPATRVEAPRVAATCAAPAHVGLRLCHAGRVGLLAASLATRDPFRVSVIRDRGVMARMVDDGDVENIYRLHIMNAMETMQTYRIDVSALHGVNGLRIEDAQDVKLGPAESRDVSMRVRLAGQVAASRVGQILPIQLGVEQLGPYGQSIRVLEKSTFVLPR